MSDQLQDQNLPPQDQTHGYNANAEEAIAAMPKDEQGLPVPNETAYNNSQVILNSDTGAMARSKEIERWSDKASEYAESAADEQRNLANRDLTFGRTAEKINNNAVGLSKSLAINGVALPGDEGRIIAKDSGMSTTNLGLGSTAFDRSPSNVNLSQQEIEEKAIDKAKKIVN